MTEYSLLQQQLDPNVEGKIARDQFLRVMKHYFTTRSRLAASHDSNPAKHDVSTPRSSVSDQPRPTKSSEMSEPELVSEAEPIEEPLRGSSPPALGVPNAADDTMTVRAFEEGSCARQWQAEFDRHVEEAKQAQDPVSQGLEMAMFMAEFQVAAETAMEAIISALAVDDDAHSLFPLSLDDDQFLATDYSDTHETLRLGISKYLVGGLIVYVTTDEVAHKVLGHQLRAARALHEAILSTDATLLRVPLQCVVDYLGFRGFVIAQLPDQQPEPRILSSRMLLSCGRSTQVVVREQCETVWKHLGIFVEEFTQGRDASQDRLPHFIGAAAGVSAIVSSGRLACYLHNLTDVFPAADASPWSALRPEMVSQLGSTLALYPTSCTSSLSEGQKAVLEQAVTTVEEHIRSIIIPAFVDCVEAQSASLCDSYTLIEAYNREGINTRCLGLCFEAARSKQTKALFLSEMIARACKYEVGASLQYAFRDAGDEVKRIVSDVTGTGEDCRSIDAIESSNVQVLSREIVSDKSLRVAHEFLTLMLGHGSGDSKTFWHERIVPRILSIFEFSSREVSDELIGCLPSEELVHWPQVLQAVKYHTGIAIDNDSDVDGLSLAHLPGPENFSINPQTRLLCETTFQCKHLLAQTDELVGSGRVEEALEIVKTHVAILGTTPRGDASPVLGRLLLCAAELSLLLGLVEPAEQFALLAIEASGKGSAAYARALLMTIRVSEAQHKPLEELRALFEDGVDTVNHCLGSGHALVFDFYTTMIDASTRHQDRDAVDRIFSELASLVKDCYGKTSTAYADVRRNQGQALAESGRVEEAASVLDEAFAVYDKLTQEQSSGRETAIQDLQAHGAACLYMSATLQAAHVTRSGHEAALTTAVRALNLREACLPADHVDVVSSLLQVGQLCEALADLYRAQEYYRRALGPLKTHFATEETTSQLRKVSQAVVNIHLRSLSAEKLAIVDKTKTRFKDITNAMEAALLTTSQHPETPGDLELIRQVTHALLTQDPVEYVDSLISNTAEELQAQRRNRFASETVRRDSAAEDPTSPSRVGLPPPAPASRFASFAIGQPLPRSLQAAPNDTTVTSPSLLLTPSGAFSYGAQLAALLFLAALPDDQEQ